jgi:hypothetical protein
VGVAVGYRIAPGEAFLAVALVPAAVLLLVGFILLPTGDRYFTGGLLGFLLGNVTCGLVWGALLRRVRPFHTLLDS